MKNKLNLDSQTLRKASLDFELAPPEGHEERFALKLSALDASRRFERNRRRNRTLGQILTGAAAASLIWVLAYSFFVSRTPASANPFEAKMTTVDLSYRAEIQRMTENILRSAATPGQRAAAEEALRRFSADQEAFDNNIAASLPRNANGLDVLYNHYTTSLRTLQDLRRDISSCDTEPSIIILN